MHSLYVHIYVYIHTFNRDWFINLWNAEMGSRSPFLALRICIHLCILKFSTFSLPLSQATHSVCDWYLFVEIRAKEWKNQRCPGS